MGNTGNGAIAPLSGRTDGEPANGTLGSVVRAIQGADTRRNSASGETSNAEQYSGAIHGMFKRRMDANYLGGSIGVSIQDWVKERCPASVGFFIGSS